MPVTIIINSFALWQNEKLYITPVFTNSIHHLKADRISNVKHSKIIIIKKKNNKLCPLMYKRSNSRLVLFHPRSDNQGTLSTAAAWAQPRRETASEEDACSAGLHSTGIIRAVQGERWWVPPTAAHRFYTLCPKISPFEFQVNGVKLCRSVWLNFTLSVYFTLSLFLFFFKKTDILGYYVS